MRCRLAARPTGPTKINTEHFLVAVCETPQLEVGGAPIETFQSEPYGVSSAGQVTQLLLR
jgi:hypothetical protein